MSITWKDFIAKVLEVLPPDLVHHMICDYLINPLLDGIIENVMSTGSLQKSIELLRPKVIAEHTESKSTKCKETDTDIIAQSQSLGPTEPSSDIENKECSKRSKYIHLFQTHETIYGTLELRCKIASDAICCCFSFTNSESMSDLILLSLLTCGSIEREAANEIFQQVEATLQRSNQYQPHIILIEDFVDDETAPENQRMLLTRNPMPSPFHRWVKRERLGVVGHHQCQSTPDMQSCRSSCSIL
jgi:hypothetical protein